MNTCNLGNITCDNSFFRSSLCAYSDNLSVGHFNCRSFNLSERSSKINEIRNVVVDSLLSVVGVSETWLKPSIPSSRFEISGYSCCRNDRPCVRGGGVALFVSKSIKYKVVYSGSQYGIVECLFVELLLGSRNVLVGVVYLPRGNFRAFESEVADVLVRYSDVIILGDFNNNLFDLSSSYSVRESCRRLNVSIVHNSIPTHFSAVHNSTSLLDFVLVSDRSCVCVSNQVVCPSISDHAFIFVSLNVSVLNVLQFFEYVDYNALSCDDLQEIVSSTDFSALYSTSDVDFQCSSFSSCLGSIHNAFPIKKG